MGPYLRGMVSLTLQNASNYLATSITRVDYVLPYLPE
jgi:hypothetical protein